MRLRFLAPALEELAGARDYYASENSSLVAELEFELDAAVDHLCAFPSAAKSVDAVHRSYKLRRFPYLLIYRQDNDEIVVVAFAHGARMPGYWVHRSDKPQA